MSCNNYYAHGLHIQSEFVCPELPLDPRPDGSPDVTIHLLSPVSSISESLENRYYEVRPGVFRLAVPGVGQYLVEEVECPANSVPVGVRQTGMEGARNGQGKEAYA